MELPPLSFIILRHVRTEAQNAFWNECYDCIRMFYRTIPVYIIDDHSTHVPTRIGAPVSHTTIIESEFAPGRAEVLPYYYYYTNEFSENTVVLHDTVFINAKIDETFTSTESYHFLWDATHRYDSDARTEELITLLDPELVKTFRQKDRWNVCFGGMAILNLEYIKNVFDNTDYFEVLLREIQSRDDRMCFERIIAVLLLNGTEPDPVMGDIHATQQWYTRFAEYKERKDARELKRMNKIWTGR